MYEANDREEIARLDDGTTIKFSLKFFIGCMSALIVVIIIFVSMRNDISNSLLRLETQGKILEDQGKAIRSMQDTILQVQFRQERDRRDVDGLQEREKYNK